jgi:hypothetical protein
MFSYDCPSCGAPAFSSANLATVGVCPSCSRPLATHETQPPVPAGVTAGEADDDRD